MQQPFHRRLWLLVISLFSSQLCFFQSLCYFLPSVKRLSVNVCVCVCAVVCACCMCVKFSSNHLRCHLTLTLETGCSIGLEFTEMIWPTDYLLSPPPHHWDLKWTPFISASFLVSYENQIQVLMFARQTLMDLGISLDPSLRFLNSRFLQTSVLCPKVLQSFPSFLDILT